MGRSFQCWLCAAAWFSTCLVAEAQLQPVGAPIETSEGPVAVGPGEPDLYAPRVLRTIGLKFDQPASAAARVTAELSIDGRPQRTIGVWLPPVSSGDAASPSRPWTLVVDSDDRQALLFGHHTTQLWPAASAEHLWRRLAALASARHYLPAPQSNLVLVEIPSKSMGLLVNQQTPDKHFTSNWFDSRGGTRWRVAADGQSALQYRGVDLAQYAGYQVESGDHPQAWTDLLQLCQILSDSPAEDLDTQLEPLLDLDSVLWMLAWENAWQIADGYLATGAGYEIWRDPQFGRFHLIPVSGEPIVWSDPAAADPALAEPLAGADRADRPLWNRLLANPRLKARYLAHLATVARHSMDWNYLQPLLKPLREAVAARLPAGDVERDLFLAACEGGEGVEARHTLRDFCQRRRDFLLAHPAIGRAVPEIVHVRHRILATDADGKLSERSLVPQSGQPAAGPRVGDTIEVVAELMRAVPPEAVLLHYQIARNGEFQVVPMEPVNRIDAAATAGANGRGAADRLVYSLVLPKLPAGADLAYYVEARSAINDGPTGSDVVASRFWPAATVIEAPRLHVEAVKADSSVVRINELMPSNHTAVQDPQGEYEDWVELVNLSGEPVDVSGMYLTDAHENLRKWQFPVGTVIAPHGRLVVWLDEHTKSLEGLHASFKLAVRGEQVLLVDRDEMNNQILDQVQWPPLRADVAFGRVPDGKGDFHPVVGTPGSRNPERP